MRASMRSMSLRPLRLLIPACVALAFATSPVLAQVQTSPMTWDGAAYTCHHMAGGNPEMNIPSWEQQVPIFFIVKRSFGNIQQGTFTCWYDTVPVTPPDPDTVGPAVVEAMTWEGQAYKCAWLGQSGSENTVPLTANLAILRADAGMPDGYACA